LVKWVLQNYMLHSVSNKRHGGLHHDVLSFKLIQFSSSFPVIEILKHKHFPPRVSL
jgi:hypothetical protein